MNYSDEKDLSNFKKVNTSSWNTIKDNVYLRLMNAKYIKDAIGETRWREVYMNMCDFVRKACEINNPLMLIPIDKEEDKDILEEDYDYPVQVILFDADINKVKVCSKLLKEKNDPEALLSENLYIEVEDIE